MGAAVSGFSVRNETRFLFRVFFVSVFVLAAFASMTRAQNNTENSLPDGQGKQTVLAKCTQCHGAETFSAARKSGDDWDRTLTKMTSSGLSLTDEEYDVILTYLTKNLGPSAPTKTNVNKATSAELQKALAVTDKEAQAIVDYRTAHGDFKTWQEVSKVEGVDAKKIEAKKDSISF